MTEYEDIQRDIPEEFRWPESEVRRRRREIWWAENAPMLAAFIVSAVVIFLLARWIGC